MKAVILTLALAENYGAVLQTYALAKILEKLGVESAVYKYDDKERITKGLTRIKKIRHSVWKKIKSILTLNIKSKKYNKFREEYIPFTEKTYKNNKELREEPGNYDLYIAGSDQIWNPNIFIDDFSYFLDFVPEGKEKISYASSLGSASFDIKKDKEKISKLLNSFKYISVREESGKNIIEETTKKNVDVVLDPTLLLDKDEWFKFLSNSKEKVKKFNGILCYIMPGDKKVTNAIESIAQQLHQMTKLPILRIGIKEYELFKYGYNGCDIFAGPLDFLEYFKNAEYVVTNSFHGTAFSVNFGKKFYAVINNELNKESALHERITSLLKKVNATNAIISTDNISINENWKVNLEDIKVKLDSERKKSISYLKKSINIEKIITKFENCFGCTACEAICPFDAITMVENKKGFFCPKIDMNKCRNCGLCDRVCPSENRYIKKEGSLKAFALQHKDINIRMKSTSGGAFIALSDNILKKNGSIYGAIYTDVFKVQHIRAIEKTIRDKMCGSKYCQSDIEGIYCKVLEDLKRKIPVLFTGTSCQIDGLKHFLSEKKCDISLLVTCDLICHGVPSPRIWKDHIRHIENIRNKKIIEYKNRSKIRGWHAHNECIYYEDNSIEWITKLSQNFKDLFYGHYIVRESCENCPYAGKPGVADITIGDFWGCEDIMPEIDDNLGTSILIINSEKGNGLFNEIINEINFWDIPLDKALKHNHIKSIKRSLKYEEFWQDYTNFGFEYITKKYVGNTFLGKIKYYIKKYLRNILVKLKLIHI